MKKLLFLLLFSSSCQAFDIECVAKAVYFESWGESIAGQAAVAQVILNRAEDSGYPDTPCGVVKQKKKGVWQFSYHRRSSLDIPEQHIDRYYLAKSIVECVLDKQCTVPKIENSTVYYACEGRNAISFPPTWDKRKLKFRVKLGNHCFFSEV